MKLTYTNRCLSCGLLLRHHRDQRNRSMTCDDARRVHPRATVVRRTLHALLLGSRRAS